MNWISASVGEGLSVIAQGLSVVPAIVMFCQGRKKMMRPSLVAGSNNPILAGLKTRQKKLTSGQVNSLYFKIDTRFS